MKKATTEFQGIETLEGVAESYIEDADTVMQDGKPHWGLEILLADLLQIAHEKGLGYTKLVAQGIDLHQQRTREGIYGYRNAERT